jgi:hypothetical protein
MDRFAQPIAAPRPPSMGGFAAGEGRVVDLFILEIGQ